MVIYVAHCDRSKYDFDRAIKITNQLQFEHPENCYICPLNAFSHLPYKNMPKALKKELRRDLISVCDMVVVASDITPIIDDEIEFAHLLEMGVEYLENC